MNRRNFLTGMGGLGTLGMGAFSVNEWNERSLRAQVFIAKASSYQADLESIIAAGLSELGLSPAWAKGRSVLLKPNLVEPTRDALISILIRPSCGRLPRSFGAGGHARSLSPRDRATVATSSSCSTSPVSGICSNDPTWILLI